MNRQIVIFLSILIFHLIGCSQSKEEKAFTAFNEATAFALDAGKCMEQGNQEEGRLKYLRAIDKYKETLKIDELHKGAASSIGICYFSIRKYEDAILWYEKAIKTDSSYPVNYQFLGLSQINKGRIYEGEKNLDKSHEMHNSQEMKAITIENLVEIGNLAYSYGDYFEKDGKIVQGNDYRKFGINVLKLALKYSENDNNIEKTIEEYTAKMNEKTIEIGLEKTKAN